MKHAVRVTLWVLVAVLLSAPAMAQMPEWTDRGFLNFDFVYQIQSNSSVTSSATQDVYGETATLSTAQVIKGQGATFDIGGGARVWRNLGVGIAYSRLSTTGGAAVSAQVPHPLFYNQMRTATGAATGLKHEEQQVHLFAIWMMPVSEKIQVGVFGGPTIFQVKQDVVSGASFTEVGPPYTAVNLTFTQSQVSKTQVGVNIGGDVTYKITKMFGVGGFARYAAATASVVPATGASAVKIKVGGFQIGFGARVAF